MCLRILILFLFGISAQLCYAQIYQWVDENGNVHFGDRPPEETQTTEVSGDLNPLNITEGSDTGYTLSTDSDAEILERLRLEDQARRSEMAPACNEARSRLRVISGRVYFTDEDGDEYTISEAERAEMEEDLRADIERYCD